MNGDAPIELRPLGPFDLRVAAALHGECFDNGWSQSAMAELLAMTGSFGLLGLAGVEPVALVLVQAGSPDAEILTLCVLPSHRRRGIAKQLLSAVRVELSARGCIRLLLEVADDNNEGQSLYFDQLFVQIGRRTGYYRRGREDIDALVLACDLD
jgi:ribosomal-protein-alanine N-acetyltransferase